jgi:hypothetical protein
VDTPRTAPIRATTDLVERVTGGPASGCPWRAFYRDDVAAVIRAHDWDEEGQLREWWGDDPEWWLVEALNLYRKSLKAVRADVVAVRSKRG